MTEKFELFDLMIGPNAKDCSFTEIRSFDLMTGPQRAKIIYKRSRFDENSNLNVLNLLGTVLDRFDEILRPKEGGCESLVGQSESRTTPASLPNSTIITQNSTLNSVKSDASSRKIEDFTEENSSITVSDDAVLPRSD